MRLRDFMLDRLLYLFVYFLMVTLLVVVIQLDVLQRGIGLGFDTVIYIYVLSAAGALFYLIVDYVRQRPFYRQAAELLRSDAGLDETLNVKAAATREQRCLQRALVHNYSRYMRQLAGYRERQEQHLHFVNQWVHYMKTPVSVIGLNVQQSETASTLREAQALLESVGEENERLAHGLEMMLHTARLEKFEMDVSLRRVELNGLVRQVVNEHKKAFIRYRLFPKIVAAAPQMWVETDEKWMRFVLNQLITNAIKYTKLAVLQEKRTDAADGQVGGNNGENPPENSDGLLQEEPQRQSANRPRQLVISLEMDDDGTRVCIADEGIGIPEHDLPRIFDPFFTGDNGRLTSESTGMGLFLARQVCNRLGHRLSAESDRGAGTAMTLSFAADRTLHAGLREESHP